MDDKSEPPPPVRQRRKDRVEAFLRCDIALQNKVAVEARGERAYPSAERLALIGKGERGAVVVQRLGYAPGDRTFVGDAHDEALLTRHQPHFLHHSSPLPS